MARGAYSWKYLGTKINMFDDGWHQNLPLSHCCPSNQFNIPFTELFPVHGLNLRWQPAVNPLDQHTQNRIRAQNKRGQ